LQNFIWTNFNNIGDKGESFKNIGMEAGLILAFHSLESFDEAIAPERV